MANNVGVAVPVAQWPQINGSQDSLSMNGLGMPPDIALQEQRLNRRQQLANVLLQRSLQPAQGQMVGRFYVPPSWAQGLAQLGTAAAGAGLTVANDNKMRDLSQESGNQLQQAMQAYQQKLAPKAVEQDAYGPGTPVPNTVSYDMQNMPDPSLTPSGTFDIDKIQPDRSREVSENINKIAMLMSPGEIQAGDLQGAIDKGHQYTRQPFTTPESQITIPAPTTEGQRPTGTQYVERTPEERQQALVELLASQHPQAQRIAQMLMQQEQHNQQLAAARQQHLADQGFTATENQLNRESGERKADKTLDQALLMGLITKEQKDQMLDLQRKAEEDRTSHNKAIEGIQRSQLDLHRQQIVQGKVPPGYRQSAEGNLEAIPGGPADTKLQGVLNQDTAMLQSSTADMDRLASAANQLLSHKGLGGITGIAGAFPNMPGGSAADAQALIDTLKSQIGFNVLQNMRNNSKTGGALGAVSDAEGKRLENNLAALDKAQSTEQMQKSLRAIIDYTNGAKDRLREAYNLKHKGADAGATAAPAIPSGPAKIMNDADYDALPPGATFIDPEGKTRKKP